MFGGSRRILARQSFAPVLRRCLHVKSWDLPVSPGGTLKVRLPTKCYVRISPLDPHSTNWDQARVDMEVLGESDADFISSETAERVTAELNVQVISDHEPGRNFLQLEAPPESAPTALARHFHHLRAWIGGPFRGHRPLFDSRVIFDVRIPGKFDLDIEMTSGAVELREVFEGDVKIQSGDADVAVNKLKSMYIDIETDSGDFTASVLQGNVSVRCCAGRVDVGRIQGPIVKLVTDSGDLQARAMYADYAMLRSKEGTVRLGGAHGYTKVRTGEGNIEAMGVEGRFDVETDSGDVEANLSVPKVVSIRSRTGDVSLGLPETFTSSFLFEGGASVDIDEAVLPSTVRQKGRQNIVRGTVSRGEDVQSVGESVPSIYARAPRGDVVIKKQSWGEGMHSAQRGAKERFPRWVVVT